jgi:hypothetical protein
MKYLGVIYKKAVLGSETWDQLGETTKNTVWPNEGAHPVLRGNAGGGLVGGTEAAPSRVFAVQVCAREGVDAAGALAAAGIKPTQDSPNRTFTVLSRRRSANDFAPGLTLRPT